MKSAADRILELREQGYKIKVKQLRQGTVGFAPFGFFTKHEIRDRQEKDPRLQAHPRGGKTIITITTPEGRTVEGVARCRIDDINDKGKWRKGDCFNKKIGLTIALGRATKALIHDQELVAPRLSQNGNGSTNDPVYPQVEA